MTRLQSLRQISKSIAVVIAKAEYSAQDNPLGVAPLLEKLYQMQGTLNAAIIAEKSGLVSKSGGGREWGVDHYGTIAGTAALIKKQLKRGK